MGAINIGARNGGKVKVVAPDNPDIGAEATLPKHTGTLATLEDISTLTDLDVNGLTEALDQIEENKQDIIELEEEIEALAPTFDRGQWDYKEPDNPLGAPEIGTYFTLDADENVSNDFANTAEIVFNNEDVLEATHTWAGVEAGQYIELFDTSDSEFLLAEIDEVKLEIGYVKFAVTVKQSEGGPSGLVVEDTENHRVRIKIFELPETDVTTLMPKAGGTFTGKVKHKKDIDIEPTMPSRFVTVKNYYSTNADGSSAGTGGTQFGLNFDLDHGNTGYNTVQWSNRYGNILTINGGEGRGAKYLGTISEDTHLVNKGYVDSKAGSSDLITLTTAGDVFVYYHSTNQAPASNYFSANLADTKFNTTWHLNNLKSERGANVLCKDYEATNTTMLEIWKEGTLRVKTTLRAWEPSSRGNNCIQAIASGGKPAVALGATLAHGSDYQIIVTNLRKK